MGILCHGLHRLRCHRVPACFQRPKCCQGQGLQDCHFLHLHCWLHPFALDCVPSVSSNTYQQLIPLMFLVSGVLPTDLARLELMARLLPTPSSMFSPSPYLAFGCYSLMMPWLHREFHISDDQMVILTPLAPSLLVVSGPMVSRPKAASVLVMTMKERKQNTQKSTGTGQHNPVAQNGDRLVYGNSGRD